ncbi:DUF386 family protein [bacterium]|nr:DUF386 family protein [bacterium]
MILDSLKNWRRYAAPGSRLARAFMFLENEWDPSLPDGRIDVLGDEIFALPQGYDTHDPATRFFESHERYLDIQYVIAGAEAIGWCPLEGLAPKDAYNPERDIAFWHHPANWTPVLVHVGQFAVLYPEDAHMPGLRMEGFPSVRKVVMKVLV